MIGLRPSAQQERWLSAAARVHQSARASSFHERTGHWSVVRPLTRIALFVLGLFVASLVATIAGLLRIPASNFIAGLILVLAGETLIARRRLFAAGIEEALEVAGLVMIAVQLLDSFSIWRNVTEGALLVAAAFAVAGVRLLNPLFTTLAAVAVSVACGDLFDRGSVTDSSTPVLASAYCLLLAFLGLSLGAVTFRRPSHDRMADWLVVVMPPAAYLWIASAHNGTASLDYLYSHTSLALASVAIPLVFGFAALCTGLLRRTHAPLLAFALCVACVAYELRKVTGMPLEVRLIVWGTALLAIAVALDRILRTPRGGISSQQLRERDGPLELLQLAGAAGMTPHAEQVSNRGFEGGGGTFSGGGASGKY